MKTEVSVKTITEVEKPSGVFLISCFSDGNEDGTTTPSLFKSQVIDKSMEIDNVDGKEGELMLSYSGNNVGDIDENGNLILNIDSVDDDVNKYEKTNENLTYNG